MRVDTTVVKYNIDTRRLHAIPANERRSMFKTVLRTLPVLYPTANNT